MTEIPKTDFDIEFIERTQKIIREYKGEFEVSLLLNCLMGLIIFPNEFSRKYELNFLDQKTDEVDVIKNIISKSDSIFNPKKRKRKQIKNEKKNVRVFLRKLRNGFEHANITTINDKEKWIGLIVEDKGLYIDNIPDLKVNITSDELRELAIYLSNEYQKNILRI